MVLLEVAWLGELRVKLGIGTSFSITTKKLLFLRPSWVMHSVTLHTSSAGRGRGFCKSTVASNI